MLKSNNPGNNNNIIPTHVDMLSALFILFPSTEDPNLISFSKAEVNVLACSDKLNPELLLWTFNLTLLYCSKIGKITLEHIKIDIIPVLINFFRIVAFFSIVFILHTHINIIKNAAKASDKICELAIPNNPNTKTHHFFPSSKIISYNPYNNSGKKAIAKTSPKAPLT